jgi:GTPase Era involved in 16S rRNA processing
MKFFYTLGAFGESQSWKTTVLNALAGKSLFASEKLEHIVQVRHYGVTYQDSPEIILTKAGKPAAKAQAVLDAMHDVDIVLYCIHLSYYSNKRSQTFCRSLLPGLNYIAVLTGKNTADSPEELEDAWDDCIQCYGLDKKRSILIAPKRESDIDPLQIKKLKRMIKQFRN